MPPSFIGHTKTSLPKRRPTLLVRGLLLLTFVFTLFIAVGVAGAVVALTQPTLFHQLTGNIFTSPLADSSSSGEDGRSRVLGETISNPLLQFNVPATFTAAISAAEITIQGITNLGGAVTADSTLDVAGVSTFNSDVIIEGNLVINQDFVGNGINIDVGEGQVTGSNLVYSVVSGDGITVSGTQNLTIANTDRGSDQKIFRTIKVGDTTFAAGSNTDTLTFAAGDGVTVAMDSGNKKITIGATSADSAADITALEDAIGTRVYTANNYLTDSQTITASLEALDAAIASAGGHNAVTLAGSYDYLTLSSQQITLGQIDLTTDVSGVLPIANGGTGASSLNNLFTLATHTTGNYVASIADSGSSLISVSGSGSENAAVTLGIVADSLDFSEFKDDLALDASTNIALDGSEMFSLTNTGTGDSLRINDQASDTTPFRITADGNIGIGVTGNPGQKVHIGDGNMLFEGGGETAMIFKRGVTFTGGASGTSANPIFQMGRIVQAGDGDPEIRFLYSDDSASERPILEFDRKGIVSSVKTDVGSFFEGHISGDTHPYFRLNSYPNMRLEMGAGGSSDTDVAIARTGTNTLGLITNGNTRLTVNSNGNVGIGTTGPGSLLAIGSSSQFQVNSSGAIAAATGLTSSGTITFSGLSDGIVTATSGVLGTSATLAGGLITADSLDFTEFKDAMTLDATTDIALAGNNFTFSGTGNIGIGTTTVSAKLHSLATTEQLRLSYDASNYTAFTAGSTGDISIAPTGGDTSITGNLGIGTSAPARVFHLRDANAAFRLDRGDSVSGAFGLFVNYSSTAYDWINQSWAYGSLLTNNFAIFDMGTAVSGAGTARFTVEQTTGYIGIGTSDPNALLTVGSSNQFQVNSSGAIAAATGITSSGTITFSGLSSAGLVTNTSGGVLGTTSTIGASYITADSLDFSEFADSPTLDANMAISQSSNTWTQSYTGNTTSAFTYNANSLTTASGIALNANSLTTGKGIDIQSTSTALTTGSLIDLSWAPASATIATGDLFKLNIGANATLTGNLLALYNNSSSIFRVGTAQINSDVPHSFNAAGDVSVAYDIAFTNQTSSAITSLGPLSITAGEAFENNDLNLVAYGTGKINLINSGLGLQTSEKVIFDTDDAGDSYLAHSNSNNYVSFFSDNTEAARFKSDGSVDGNTTFNANAFDLAEYYPTKDATVEAGDVVSIAAKTEADAASTDSPYLIERTSESTIGQVLGVVSTKPGFALGGGSFRSEMCTAVLEDGGEEKVRASLIENEKALLAEAPVASDSAVLGATTELSDATLSTIEDKIKTCKALSSAPIALAGRVPVKVDTASATAIKTGDLLMASPTAPGKAVKATQAGWVIGRALEDYKAGNDTVMTFVFVTYYNGGDTTPLADIRANTTPLELGDELKDLLGAGKDNANQMFLVAYANLDVVGDVVSNTMTAAAAVKTGSIAISGTENSITTSGNTALKLQTSESAGTVDLFNGKIIFNTNGDIITLSDVQAKLIGAKNFVVVSGTDDKGNSTSSVGTGTLKAGLKENIITNSNVKENSKVFITPRVSTRGQSLFVSAVKNGTFTISIDTPVTTDLTFDYWILGVQ